MLKALLIPLVMLAYSESWAVKTLIDLPQGRPKGLVIIAPAKRYLMQERLFSSLANKLSRNGFLTIRFNWSKNTLKDPNQELQRATQDIQHVIVSAQKTFGFQRFQTILISKSFSTKALGPSLQLVRTHILLTPNCSAEFPFQKTYWNVLNQANIKLKMIISVNDPYCDVNEIRHTLSAINRPNSLATTKGDHNFVVTDPNTNTQSYQYQDLVINYTTNLIARSALFF